MFLTFTAGQGKYCYYLSLAQCQKETVMHFLQTDGCYSEGHKIKVGKEIKREWIKAFLSSVPILLSQLYLLFLPHFFANKVIA